ncbi:MAG: ATP-dependent DNA helicase Rep, partial [Alcaligenaceae bacterium]
LQALGTYAATHEKPLFHAVFDEEVEAILSPRQLEPLRTFAEFIQRAQWRAGRERSANDPTRPVRQELFATESAHTAPVQTEAADVLLDDILGTIQYERYLYDTLDEKPAQTRWQNVMELVSWLKRKAADDGMSLFELVQHVALVTMLERGEEDEPDAVKLSTLHASKGLEYPHVFLAGVEEGLLPHLGKDDEQGDPARAAESLAGRIQEERRLMYVGITRAQRSLHLSWCKKRRRAREDLVREPSRFIEEMGLADVKVDEDDASRTLSPKERLGMLKALLKKAN